MGIYVIIRGIIEYEEVLKMSLIDYDAEECEYCGHVGLLPDGDWWGECTVCGRNTWLGGDEPSRDEFDDD